MALPFKFQLGHTLVLKDDHGREQKHYVREIRADGWMLEPYAREGERVYFAGETVRRAYLAARMRYEPWDDDAIPAARRRRLRESFVAQPLSARRTAVRRLAIVKGCERATADGMAKGTALRSVPATVIAERGAAWHAEDVEEARALFRERERKGLLTDGEHFVEPPRTKAPCERTVWGWMTRFAESGRSVNSLLDDSASKGRRESQLSPEQDEQLAIFLKDHVKPGGGFTLAAAFKRLNEVLEGKSIRPIGRRTFKRRLQREHDRRGMVRLEHGRRAARRVGSVSERPQMPLWPLHKVESDHVLLNINVKHGPTGINLGRPWLSVLRDLYTGEPTGLHTSFLSPSWATLSRALAHSMWPKDLSGHPEIKNSWLAEGVLDECSTDRGIDYISHAGRWASAEMGFEILNLPGYSPWLKGSLERWNREVKAEIMTFRDGVTSFGDPEYRGRRNPTMDLAELNGGLLKWVVDDYVSEAQEARGGMSRNDVWLEALDGHGPPRPVHDFDRYRRMQMVPRRRSIQNRGVEFGGFFFRDEHGELAEIRKRHDGPTRFMILVDPWDTGYIELLDGTRWLLLLNEDPTLGGVSRYRSEFYWNHAMQANPGRRLTIDDFRRSREVVDDDAGRVLAIGRALNRRGSQNLLGRFLELGAFMTPVPLRPVRFAPPPVEIPGMIERGGVLRPADRPEPTLAALLGDSAFAPPPIPGARSDPRDGRQSSAVPARPAGRAIDTENVFERLAAGARARSLEIGA